MTKVKQNKHRQVVLFVFIGFLIIASLYYRFILVYQLDKLNNLNQQIETQLQLFYKNETEFKHIEENKLLVQTTKSELQMVKNKLPTYADLIKLIKDINKTVTIYDIDVKSIIWQNPLLISIDKDIVYEVPLEFTMVGKYDNIKAFINGLNESKNISSVKNIQISTDTTDIKSFIKTKLYLSMYAFK